MAALPPPVRTCIDEAVARAPRLIDQAVDQAVERLDEELRRRDSPAERQELAGAVREMLRQRPMWRLSFPQALRKAVESPPKPASGGLRLHPSSLTLVDDSVVAQSIESSRLAQEVAARVEQPLTELDALMSSALGLDGVHPDQNPLRPDVFTQTLRDIMSEGEPQPGLPAIWMRYMAAPIGEELKELYRSAAKLLKDAQVRAASYRVVTAPGALGPRASEPAPLASQPARLGPTSQPASLGRATGPGLLSRGFTGFAELVSQVLRGPSLREFLSGGHAQHEQQPLAPAYYAGVQQELAQIEASWQDAPYDRYAAQQHEELPPVDRPMREVATDKAIDDQVWGELAAPRQRALVRTRLKQQARQVGQAMGLELVRQIVDQVAQDPRLLAPVREAVVALEPSLARLAMQSPHFMGQDENPARQLIERVAARSFKYNDEFSAPFGMFFEEVSEAFNALNRLDTLADAKPFESALAGLEASWSRQDRAEEAQREKVMAAVRFAEKRQAESEQIAWQLSQRSDLDGVPGVVQDFLYGTWSLVMAHAKLTTEGKELDPGGYVGVITDLLWSVKRDETLRDPARAFECIPRVLVKLRAGLDLIGHPPAESESVFNALERLHRPVLKLRAKHRRQVLASTTGPAPLDDDDLLPSQRHTPEPPEELWLAPEDLNACGFEDTMPSDYAELAAVEAVVEPSAARAPAPQQPLPDAQVQAVIASLREGTWVDLFSRQKWRRAQLVWAGNRGTLFMFVSHGGRPHSMTRRSLQRLVLNRLLRPLDGHEVVQHAIETLARPQQEALAA
jgi:hypothetical protein